MERPVPDEILVYDVFDDEGIEDNPDGGSQHFRSLEMAREFAQGLANFYGKPYEIGTMAVNLDLPLPDLVLACLHDAGWARDVRFEPIVVEPTSRAITRPLVHMGDGEGPQLRHMTQAKIDSLLGLEETAAMISEHCAEHGIDPKTL